VQIFARDAVNRWAIRIGGYCQFMTISRFAWPAKKKKKKSRMEIRPVFVFTTFVLFDVKIDT
jgi:hypothetical protein